MRKNPYRWYLDDRGQLNPLRERPSRPNPMTTDAMTEPSTNRLPPSAAIYNRAMLAIYDHYVLGFSNTWVWRCPSRQILALYDREVSDRHLEVGVGTGYFPDHCRFPVARPAIDLLDIHPRTLEATARRLQRYRPRVVEANVMEPLHGLEAGYASIAINYLLHCLPGPLLDKGRRIFDQLIPLLDAGEGRLFGSPYMDSSDLQTFFASMVVGSGSAVASIYPACG